MLSLEILNDVPNKYALLGSPPLSLRNELSENVHNQKLLQGDYVDTTQIAKFLMKAFERYPVSPDEKVRGSNEVFRHPAFRNATESDKRRIMLESSRFKFDEEMGYPWDHYFGIDLKPLLRKKIALDLGCLNGGRGVAWAKRYELSHLFGIDVRQEYIDAAIQFKDAMGIKGNFRVANGEMLPFEDDKFDAVLSFDVFEHVQDLEKTLRECYRVLKKGGRLFVVFPGYFHPIEHHLALVTSIPCIHYFFSGGTLIKAYNEILEERGNGANWYKRDSWSLENWERCNTINGTTHYQFRRLVDRIGWRVVLQSKKRIGAVGRRVAQRTAFRVVSFLLAPFSVIPCFQEFVLHRITYILEK